MKKIIKALLTITLSIALLFCGWVYFSTFHPAPIQDEPVHQLNATPALQSGQTVKILSWNVQFMAGNTNNHFFYDDGPDGWPDKATVDNVTSNVARFIAQQDPDVVLLQEVDDLASRTHLQDQTKMLLAALPQYTVFTESFYWKADYLPHPDIAGRVGMKLVILSKFKIDSATRIALPAITTDDIIRRQFNLKRAIQKVYLPVEGGEPLILMNTHLSAFAKGSDTMERQIEKVMEQLASIPPRAPWIIGGDFNLLPNNDAIQAFTELRSQYNDQGSELIPLISTYPSVPALNDINIDPEPWYTYMSPSDPQRRPNRTIDYLFHSHNLQKQNAAVLRGDALALSDHLPIVIEFTL